MLATLTLAFAGCPVDIPPPDNGNGDVDGDGPGTGPAVAKGFNIEIKDVDIPLDGRPEVTFFATDDAGNGIPINEIADARFMLAYLEDPPEGSTAHYVSYNTRTEDPDGAPDSGDEAVQATYDGARLSGLSQAEDGTFTYKFDTALPAGYDSSATHQLGGQFERESSVHGEVYPANPLHAFRPDGQAVAETREIVDTATCNECHTRLEFHGGGRREVQLCILCHSPQTTDANSGNTVDFATMIHKIHRGEELPSVEDGEPYQIIGYRDSVHDYSDVVFPQDARNCTACHKNNPDADFYKMKPTLAGCASCHDRTWFGDQDQTPEGYANHVGGMQVDDSLCALCHTPTAPGASPIVEAHFVPTKSPTAPGLTFEMADVNVLPAKQGNLLRITFNALDGDGNGITDLGELSTIAATFAYPAAEYENVVRESISIESESYTNNGGGSHSYTFDAELPASSDATFAVALEGRRNFTFRGEQQTQGTDSNAVTMFTLDGSAPAQRRMVVDEEKCNVCHDDLRLHGSLRTDVNYCLMCHNPNATDIARRPEEALPPETINFKDMIHLIHTGEELDMDYTVYGFGNRPHDYTHVRFPGARQECSICHVEGSTELPLPQEALSTMVTQDGTVVSEKLPHRAACTSCHDGLLPNIHSMAQTEMNVESCAVCHGSGADFAVSQVHRLEP